ncbi:unnamed protein product [Didymodactylos carnosus]|uniref:Uncharacterized protein n=1 Tax=Didymodactylos carnosus TaxID=1234261 RepID=A0A8S2VDY1_9BILA|nr:unnamed protein product [Didymodactylos carnosus]
MSRVFFAKSNAERQRAKRALQREKNLAAAIKSSDDDDTSVNEMDVPLAYPLSVDDQLSSHDLFQKDDLASQQQNNITFAESTSNDDDDDADLDELIRASDVNYERKVYTDSFLSIHNACEIIIKLARRLNLDKNKTRILLQGIRSLLPQNNKLPKTIVGLMKILATICEIPPPLRDHKQATMIFGAWLGSHHPDRNLLWGNIVKQLKELFTEEIKVAINKQQFKFIVRVQLVTFDLPALALNCNIIQFNGYNACPYCKITGKAIEKQVFYPHSSDQYSSKTIDDYRRYGVSNYYWY